MNIPRTCQSLQVSGDKSCVGESKFEDSVHNLYLVQARLSSTHCVSLLRGSHIMPCHMKLLHDAHSTHTLLTAGQRRRAVRGGVQAREQRARPAPHSSIRTRMTSGQLPQNHTTSCILMYDSPAMACTAVQSCLFLPAVPKAPIVTLKTWTHNAWLLPDSHTMTNQLPHHSALLQLS
jgi:hypothetical protein